MTYIHTGYFIWPEHNDADGNPTYTEEVDVESRNPNPESVRDELQRRASEELRPGWELVFIGTPSCGTVTF